MRIFCTIALLLWGLTCIAQTPLRVKDKVTSETIPNVTLNFRGIDKNEKSVGATNANGEWVKSIRGRTIVTASSIGYTSQTDTIFPNIEHTIYLSPSNSELNEVVVTASSHPQTRDRSIYKIDVITNAQIKERAANNLADLLVTQANVRVEQNGTLGSSVRMQGLSGEQVKILIDGVPVLGRVNGNINLNQLNLQNVDHVEIIEGPMSVIYGSDAMGGVINIITKESSKHPIDASADLYYETIGKYNVDLAGTAHNKNHAFTFNGSRNFFQGTALEDDPPRVMTWKPSLQYNLDAGYIYSGEKYKLKFSSSYFHETYLIYGTPRKDGTPTQTDSTLIYNVIANDAYNYTNRFVNKLDYTLRLDKNVLNLVGSYSNYSLKLVTYKNDLTNLIKTSEGVANQDTQKINSVMVRGIWSNNAINKLEFTAGPDFTYDHAIDEAEFGSKSMTDLAGFLNLKYSPVSNFSFQQGIRLIYNSLFKSPVVYSFNLKYNPATRWATRVSFAKGFRSPSLKELYFNYTQLDHLVYGNPNLKAEYSNNANGSMNYTLPIKSSTLEFNLTGFYNQIKNKIDYIQDPNNQLQAYLDNLPIDLYKNWGGSFILRYNLFQVFTSESGIGVTAVSKLENQTAYNYSQDYTENLNYNNRRYNFSLSVNYKYYGNFVIYNAIKMNDGTMKIESQSLAGGYHNLDAQAIKRFFQNKIDLGIGVKNAFNNTRVNTTTNGTTGGSSGLVGYGRTYFVKLSYHLN